jgi:hypothetical protein
MISAGSSTKSITDNKLTFTLSKPTCRDKNKKYSNKYLDRLIK